VSTTHFGSLLWIHSVNPHAFDANFQTVEGSLIHVTILTCGERVGTDV
jgi:hypothetical protein